MSQYVETPTKTFVAGGALARHLRVKISNGKLALAGDEDGEIGTVETPAFADGNMAVVRLRNASGSRRVVVAAQTTAGATLYAAANGKMAPSGTRVRGVALESGAGDGSVVEAILFS